MESDGREKTAVRVDVCCEYSLDFITSFESVKLSAACLITYHSKADKLILISRFTYQISNGTYLW
jgi:hypothetical protein